MDNLNMNTVTNLNDADYSTIESRVKGFRLDHPSGQILTEIVKHDDKTGEIIFKAHAVVDGTRPALSKRRDARKSGRDV